MLTIYGIKNCDSVKKAIKFFSSNNISFTFIDFDVQPIDDKKLLEWSQKSTLQALFNTKSTTYRNLGLSKMILNDQDIIDWMVKESRLIKRPVIEYDSQVLIGFNISQYEGIFLT